MKPQELVSKDLEKAIKAAYKEGANWQKEQMMKDAVEIEYGWLKLLIYTQTDKRFDIDNLKKVKLIIVKDE